MPPKGTTRRRKPRRVEAPYESTAESRPTGKRAGAPASTTEDGEQDVLSVISHDLKDPLSAITMGTSLLQKIVPQTDERAHRVLDAVSRAARRMDVLIRNAVDLTRLRAGRLDMNKQSHDLVELLESACKRLDVLAVDSKVVVERRYPPEGTALICDGERIAQVILVLGENAIRYAEGRPIVVGAKRNEPNVQISVTDTGPGLTEERLSTVFDWLSNATRPARDGPGLGLGVAKAIVVAHGGAITARSTLGQGTTFCVTLPMHPTPPEKPL